MQIVPLSVNNITLLVISEVVSGAFDLNIFLSDCARFVSAEHENLAGDQGPREAARHVWRRIASRSGHEAGRCDLHTTESLSPCCN